jgi:hypothetical protein
MLGPGSLKLLSTVVVERWLSLGMLAFNSELEASIAMILVISEERSLVLWHDHTHVTDFYITLNGVTLSETKSRGSCHEFTRLSWFDGNWRLRHTPFIFTGHVLWLVTLRVDNRVFKRVASRFQDPAISICCDRTGIHQNDATIFHTKHTMLRRNAVACSL